MKFEIVSIITRETAKPPQGSIPKVWKKVGNKQAVTIPIKAPVSLQAAKPSCLFIDFDSTRMSP